MIPFMQRLVERAQLPHPELYNGISFRKGGASSLAAAGVPDRVIKAAGRWRSDCFQLYIRMQLSELQSALVSMSKLDPASSNDESVWGIFDSDCLFHDEAEAKEAAQLLGAKHQLTR
jgi:hypothetical protein